MKTTEYLVEFTNGQKEHFYCRSIKEVIFTAMYWASEKGIDPSIVKIFDEIGHKITDIAINCKIE